MACGTPFSAFAQRGCAKPRVCNAFCKATVIITETGLSILISSRMNRPEKCSIKAINEDFLPLPSRYGR